MQGRINCGGSGAAPPRVVKGDCPAGVVPDGKRACPKHDPNCGCHGPIMSKGMVGWAGGSAGPDLFIYTASRSCAVGSCPATHWCAPSRANPEIPPLAPGPRSPTTDHRGEAPILEPEPEPPNPDPEPGPRTRTPNPSPGRSRDHTVFAEVADDATWAVIEELYALPVKRPGSSLEALSCSRHSPLPWLTAVVAQGLRSGLLYASSYSGGAPLPFTATGERTVDRCRYVGMCRRLCQAAPLTAFDHAGMG